ncbi:MAG: cupredoxin domain-containing protein [Gaiellaceae bacterium]
MRIIAFLASGLVAVALAAHVAFAGASSIRITLKEYKVLPAATSVKAGKVTFQVKNVGVLDHTFLVVKTNVPAGKLPVKKNRAVVSALGKIGPFKKGKGGTLTLTLKPGKYVLLCNVASHYQIGQYSAFTVK